MKTNLVKITLLGLVAAALTFTPTISRAQDATTNAPNATTPKKHNSGIIPFQGKVSAVNAAAGTLTAGKYTLTVTSTTKILNVTNNVPATLSDITVGENVTGSYKKAADGTLNAYSIRIGGKAKHKSKKSAGSGSSTSGTSGSN